MQTRWQTRQQLEDLLCELVSWQSKTGTKGEVDFPSKLNKKLLELDYFKRNRSHIDFHDAGKNRNAVTAFY